MIKAITGTKDTLPSEIPKWKFLEHIINATFTGFNYKEIRTPVFEETQLFARGIGEETDIVGKEMYTFTDRGGTSLTLKPEMTASVARAFIEHSLSANQPLNKLYYIAPMFRQERPQAGRLREFHQFGGEVLGSNSPVLDAELIQIACEILRALGLKHLTVKINSLGSPAAREKYKKNFKEYLKDKKSKLSDDSQKRLESNVLRIFDSKSEKDQAVLAEAPKLIEHIDKESKEHFESVKKLLDISNIKFDVDPNLVRGLDYYTQTTFEIVSGKVGSQNALVGGGRYDLLIEQLGGKPTPGVGFAAGMERILLACENEKSLSLPEDNLDIYIVRLDDNLLFKVYEVATALRKMNFKVDFDYLYRSVKAQMREANKFNSKFTLFVGGAEYSSGQMNLKDMTKGEQRLISLQNYSKEIKSLLF